MTSDQQPTTGDDPYLWLEDVTGESALDWVRQHNAVTEEQLTDNERFDRLQSDVREILDTDARIPYVRRRGEFLYNFWRDSTHVRGLWRRTTFDQYVTETRNGTSSSTSTPWPRPRARTGSGRARNFYGHTATVH